MKNILKNKKIVAAIAVVSILFIGLFAYAKYIDIQSEDRPIKAHDMYFTSNYLLEENTSSEADYTLSNWTAGDSIALKLQNFPDAERFTEVPIEYTITLDDGATSFRTEANGANETSYSNTLAASEVKTRQTTDDINIILPNDFLSGVDERRVRIKATVTAPYSYELSADFLIKKVASGYTYSVEDSVSSPYAKVTVTADTDTDLTLSWGNDIVAPDQTNPIFFEKTIENGIGDSRSIQLDTLKSGESLVFYMLKYKPDEVYTNQSADVFFVSGLAVNN